MGPPRTHPRKRRPKRAPRGVGCARMAGNMRFFFDFVSPYAYLGWTQIHALASRHGQELELVPVVFGAMLAANKATAPVDNVRRRAYMIRDLLRIAHGYG